METATGLTTMVIDQEIVEKKRAAWGTLGTQIYEKELLLQARAQASLAKLKTPANIKEVAEAEKTLKEVKAEANAIATERKGITSKFDDVTKRLMEPEKSFLEPVQKFEAAIISLKKTDQERQQKENEKQAALIKCREFLVNTRNNADAEFKEKILTKVNKAYEYALGDGDISLADLPDYLILASTRLKEVDVKISYPLNTFPSISTDEFVKMCNEILIVSPAPYLAQYQNDLRAKFSDYEVALLNKVSAIALSKQEAEAAKKVIVEEKQNADVAAKLETFAAVTPTITSGLKELKESYEIDMPETVESAIAIMTAFTLNLTACLDKLKVNKWFAFTPAQAAVALAKIKSDKNSFSPTGLTFKVVNKL
ncbi:MAG: hypothetical protein M3R27_08980 [Bacteroidota bacterium]|nr:hypothetical protein [Bacteroidota bacterium]